MGSDLVELCFCPKRQHEEGHSTCRVSPSQLNFLAIIPGLSSRLRRTTNKTIMEAVDIQQPECTTSSFDSASNTIYNFYVHLLKEKKN